MQNLGALAMAVSGLLGSEGSPSAGFGGLVSLRRPGLCLLACGVSVLWLWPFRRYELPKLKIRCEQLSQGPVLEVNVCR